MWNWAPVGPRGPDGAEKGCGAPQTYARVNTSSQGDIVSSVDVVVTLSAPDLTASSYILVPGGDKTFA